MSLHFGILLALLCAFASNLAFLYKHRGANEAVAVDIRHPLASALSLWRQKWFAIGMGVGTGAWVLHVGAMSLAPLSVVQAVLSGGLVLLAVMADKMFGFKVGRRQWLGLALMTAGLVLLGITLPASHGSHSSFSILPMVAFEAGLLGIGGLLMMGRRLGSPSKHHGVMMGAAAGVLFGVCNVGVKALTGLAGSEGLLMVALSPWLYVSLFASAAAFYASARSLQDGDAVSVIAITGTAANVCAIAGGIIVFDDPMPDTALGIGLQALAFILVIVASALTPAPVRAADRASTGPVGVPAASGA